MKISQSLLVLAIASALALSSAEAGAGVGSRGAAYSGAAAHLVIKRAANFGNHSNLSVFIDGRPVTILRYGRAYEGVLAPGDHLVTMRQAPHWDDAYPFSQQWIRVVLGERSVFTAIWRGGGTTIALEKS